MTIHDLIAEFEAKVASLFMEFRSAISAHSSPAAATAQPAPAAPSAPAAAAPAAPSVAPAAAPLAEPDTAPTIRARIEQWRANGADWPQTMEYVQTGFGLNRALTDDEWKVAIAAGCPPELAKKPEPNTGPSMEEVTAPDTLQFVDGTPNVGEVAFGVSMYLKGNCTKTINGVPENVKVGLYVSDRKAGPFTFRVNGAELPVHTPQQAEPLWMNVNGLTITLEIEQDADCTMLAALQPA